MQEQIVDKKLKVYVIDAYEVAEQTGMGNRINSVMQTCFFAISGVLPREEAIAQIKKAIEKTYGKKGAEVVKRNFASVDATLENLHEVAVGPPTGNVKMRPTVPEAAPDFVKRVQAVIIEGKGDLLPVSAFPVDGTWPTGTSQWEKRAIALEIPVWDEKICIQCNKCAFVCPHAAIRAKVYDADALAKAPATFKSIDFKGAEYKGKKYTIQVAPEDCTGCNLCVMVCPAKDKSNPKHKAIDMTPMPPLREAEAANYEFFLALPEVKREEVKLDLKGSQFLQPLFEYSGACSGCGETPYIKLMTQLFGDRALIANATGCSSIYGGNLPTTPYTVNADGRGPAWSNSLFEDNAEFGFGMRLAFDALKQQATRLLKGLSGQVGDNLVKELLAADMGNEAGIAAQRRRVVALKAALGGDRRAPTRSGSRTSPTTSSARTSGSSAATAGPTTSATAASTTCSRMTRDVNILVLDTEVYSNTGGQASKATPTGAAAKFASAGKEVGKKDLGLMAMAYGHVYVARVAFGAKDVQTVKAFQEAESYHGPSLIIAYSHCIAHGYDMAYGAEQQKLAVDSGVWPLYRFDPRRPAQGQPPLQLDSGDPKISAKAYMRNETRFRMVEKLDPERFKRLLMSAERQARQRVAIYKQLSGLTVPQISDAEIEATAPVPAGAKN